MIYDKRIFQVTVKVHHEIMTFSQTLKVERQNKKRGEIMIW